MSIAFRYAARSNVGKVRKSNQDSGYAGANLLVLADGMGGPAGGDMASVIAVDHLRKIDEVDTTQWTLTEGQQCLAEQVTQAHQEMHLLSEKDPALAGFGTTCIGLVRCQNNTLAISHIGDSRAYLLRGNDLKQVTKDHSFVQYLYETGQIRQEDMATHPNRSVLLRVLGDSVEHDTPDLMQEIAFPGDRWLLCSDGLCGYVSLEEIYDIISDRETDPGVVSERLVEAALAVGAPDNVTVVVADMVEVEDGTVLDNTPQVVGAAAECTPRLAALREQLLSDPAGDPQDPTAEMDEYDDDATQEIISYSKDRGETFSDYEAVTQHFSDPQSDRVGSYYDQPEDPSAIESSEITILPGKDILLEDGGEDPQALSTGTEKLNNNTFQPPVDETFGDNLPEAGLTETEDPTLPPAEPNYRRVRWWRMIATLVVVLVLLGGGLLVWNWYQAKDDGDLSDSSTSVTNSTTEKSEDKTGETGKTGKSTGETSQGTETGNNSGSGSTTLKPTPAQINPNDLSKTNENPSSASNTNK